MSYHALLNESDRIVRAALIGAGDFGRSLIAQAQTIGNLDVSVICDQNPQRARDALEGAGVPGNGIVSCDSPAAARENLDKGRRSIHRRRLP